SLQILGIGYVYRKIIGKQEYIRLVRYRHGNDLSPYHPCLRLLGPGEFIYGQIHLESFVPYCLYDALMAQREGVEGPREKGHVAVFRKLHLPEVELVLRDEPVYVIECRRVSKEIHVVFIDISYERQQLLVYLSESVVLLLHGKLFRTEDILACHH